MYFLQPESQHSKNQACHISQIMSGIREQSQRIVIKTNSELDYNERDIQNDTYYKGFIKRRYPMIMFVMMRFHILNSFIFRKQLSKKLVHTTKKAPKNHLKRICSSCSIVHFFSYLCADFKNPFELNPKYCVETITGIYV